MSFMTPFQYAGFYDVPRILLFHYRGRSVVLLSIFDDELDEYPAEYSVYLLQEYVDFADAGGSWDFIGDSRKQFIGKIPVGSVLFDSSKRKELDASFLDSMF